MSSFVDYFVHEYTELESKSRRNSQFLNRMISKYKYLRVHPILFKNNDAEEIEFLISFANSTELSYPMGEDLQVEFFHILEDSRTWYTFIKISKTLEELQEVREIDNTLYIETSKFTPIHVKEATWQDLINAPKLRDGKFVELSDVFEKFFNLEDDFDCNIDYYTVFSERNKPSELEIREVWCDIDSYQKYGSINRLIFWKGEFIGWINYSGRWIDDKMFNTVNPEAWKELMHVMYEISGYQKGPSIRGVTIVDMSTEKVENCISVPGFTEPDYGDDSYE